MLLRAIVPALFRFLEAVQPGASHVYDAQTVVPTIVDVVEEDESTPVFGSKQADAVVLTYTAWAEGRMRLRAVGDHGQARGVFQLHMAAGNGDARTQTKAALRLFRWDAQVCREIPMAAFVSGNCRHGHKLARYRMLEIMKALRRAGLA